MNPAGSPLSRRSLLRGGLGIGAMALGGSALLSGCSSGAGGTTAADGTTAVNYQLSWLPTTEHSGSWIASDRGFYRDGGLTVNFLNGGPNTSPDTVVMSGKALVGGSNADVVSKAITQGADLTVFGTRFQKSPFSILSLADNPIRSPQEMVGRKIGVAAINETAFNLLLKINNIDPASVDVVPVQFDPSPVTNREVDGQVVFVINEPTSSKRRGSRRIRSCSPTTDTRCSPGGCTSRSGRPWRRTQTSSPPSYVRNAAAGRRTSPIPPGSAPTSPSTSSVRTRASIGRSSCWNRRRCRGS